MKKTQWQKDYTGLVYELTTNIHNLQKNLKEWDKAYMAYTDVLKDLDSLLSQLEDVFRKFEEKTYYVL